jgi:hypothetical protein
VEVVHGARICGLQNFSREFDEWKEEAFLFGGSFLYYFKNIYLNKILKKSNEILFIFNKKIKNYLKNQNYNVF